MPDPPNSPAPDPPKRVVELVVNLDDVTGELVGDTIAELMGRGALDVWATPITMKKGRPGVMLSVLVDESRHEPFAEWILQLTGSFGVRFRQWDRMTLDRKWVNVATRLGGVKLKVGSLAGKVVTIKPEYDSVQALAKVSGVTLLEAHRAAQAAADAWLAEQIAEQGDSDDG